jgi:hypothetical protein
MDIEIKFSEGFMKTMSVLVTLLLSVNVFAAEKLIATGEVFDKEGKKKMFLYERYQAEEGGKTKDRSVYKSLDGEVLVEETMVSSNGKLERYDIDQKQLKKKGWIEVKGDKVVFNLKKPRKRNYPIETKMPKNFIVGLQITPAIRENWNSIITGKDYKFKLGVWHRQEAITFKISKEKLDDKVAVFKMSPSSFIIRAIVDPLYFTFDAKTQALISYKGRTKPKVKSGRSWRDYDGLTKYKVVTSAPEKVVKKK